MARESFTGNRFDISVPQIDTDFFQGGFLFASRYLLSYNFDDLALGFQPQLWSSQLLHDPARAGPGHMAGKIAHGHAFFDNHAGDYGRRIDHSAAFGGHGIDSRVLF